MQGCDVPATVAAACLTWSVDSTNPSAHRVYGAKLPKGTVVKRLILVIAVLLGGCVTAQEREQAREQYINGLITVARAQCGMMGFKIGTEEYGHCMTVKVNEMHQQNAYQQQRQVQIQHSIAAPQPTISPFPSPQYIPTAPPQPFIPSPAVTDCTRQGSGGYRCTTR